MKGRFFQGENGGNERGLGSALLTVGSEGGQRRIHGRDDPIGLRRPEACPPKWSARAPAQAWPAPPLLRLLGGFRQPSPAISGS